MSDHLDEEKFLPSIFYKKLEKKEDLKELKSTLHKYSSIPTTDWTYLKEFGAHLIRNYKDVLPSCNKLSFEKRCRDLNYWVKSEIYRYEKEHDVSGIINHIRNFSTDVWEQLDKEVSRRCEREQIYYPIDEIKIRKDLDDFCTIRDILLTKSESEYTCKAVNDWVDKKYNNYFSKEKCETYNKMNAGYSKEFGPFHISDNCTFYDIPTTFRSFNCAGYIPRYKIKSISNCERNIMSGELYKAVKSNDFSHHKSNVSTGTSFLIAGLTVLGIIFFFFMIYKFSPFGSFLRYNIMKKFNLTNNIDEEDGQLFERSEYSQYTDPENERHHIGYNAL
ncbi:PIR protein [Plasmodium ovale]|uniref:PIR protein n=1 Tax=Plasmodium ovale TaxID=36330 RepID=A0A1C3KKR8_PLAOA|nr:PIR protein [Plasmodium ovale]